MSQSLDISAGGFNRLSSWKQARPSRHRRICPSASTTLNPFDSECFRVAWSEHDGSSFSLTIPAQPGHQFSLWTSTILAADSWQRVDDAILTETADGVFVFTDPNPDATRGFYRIQLDSTP